MFDKKQVNNKQITNKQINKKTIQTRKKREKKKRRTQKRKYRNGGRRKKKEGRNIYIIFKFFSQILLENKRKKEINNDNKINKRNKYIKKLIN